MKIVCVTLLGLSFAATGSTFTAAQEIPTMPKVLEITREVIKPGKSGAIHDKSESNFVNAMARAKWPTHYIAMNSLSGRSRALYITGYPSFEAWEKDDAAIDKNATLSSELDKDSLTDGELLDEIGQLVLYYDEDTSYRPNPDLSTARFMEISVYKIKPGHGKGWNDLAKMVIDAHKKAGTSAHWATYEVAYGGADEYVVFSADKSMSEIDTGYAEDKQFQDALGEEGMKRFHELIESTIDSADSELFQINPRQSYVPDEWIKADPEFWKPKPAMAPAAKPAATAKPAAKPAQ
jgi:hypothetical protein